MNLNPEGKTALVTGTSRGVGLAVVRKLAEKGVQVVSVAHTVASELEDAGKLAVSADLSTLGGAEVVVKAALAELGGIDIPVNSVGTGDSDVMKLGGFLEVDDAQWRDPFNLNFFSVVWISRTAFPSLLGRRGATVNTGSINALVPAQGPVDYNEAKAALVTFGKRLSEEFGSQGVCVNMVSPGGVSTGLWCDPDGFGSRVAASMDMSHSDLLSAMPIVFGVVSGRAAEPEEVAALTVFVASLATEYLVGVGIVIDDGTVETV